MRNLFKFHFKSVIYAFIAVIAFISVIVLSLYSDMTIFSLAALPAFVVAGKSVIQLDQRKADVVKRLEELNNSVIISDTEVRAFTETEQTEYDTLIKELKSLKTARDQRQVFEESLKPPHGFNIPVQQDTTRHYKDEADARSKYSFLKALRGSVSGKLEGLEKEMHEEGIREARSNKIELKGGGLVIPGMVLQGRDVYNRASKRAMSAGTDASGGYAIATELKDWIGYLYDAMVINQLGAEFMTGLVGDIDLPTEEDIPAATWEGENDDAAESTPAIGKLSMSPHRLTTYVDLSSQLLIQTSPSIEARVRRMIANAFQLKLQATAIEGSGTDPIPTGILNHDDINVVAGDTDGLAATWANIVALETAVAANNGNTNSMAYLTNTKVRGSLKTIKKDAGSGLFLWNTINGGTTPVNEYPCAITNAMPSDLTKGEGTALSAMIFGDWSKCNIGIWSGLEIISDPYTQALAGKLRLVPHMYADILFEQVAASFAAIIDLITE